MVAGNHRAGSEGMYGLAVACVGVGVRHGDCRGVIENVGGIPARYGDAGHAGGVVEISNGAKGNWDVRRASVGRASVVLGALVKEAIGEEGIPRTLTCSPRPSAT